MKPHDREPPWEPAVDVAFCEFTEACLSGKPPDPEEFCRRHPECDSTLRQKIDDLLFIAQGLPGDELFSKLALQQDVQNKRLSPGAVLGDFRLVERLGSGGMGVVYAAEQISLHRRVALKILPARIAFFEDSVRKFHREAEAGGRQKHPGIVSVYAVGQQDGIHFIAQELVEGGVTLADRVERLRKEGDRPVRSFRETTELIVKIADALDHAHRTGVIHRDVKPSNILITGEGEPKITDFGLAKMEDTLGLTRTGDVIGTPYYMSPEQIAGDHRRIDLRTDVFSLGVTLYEMLTLALPFQGKTLREVMKRIVSDEVRDPCKVNSRIPRDLAVICLKAMEKNPGDRYATMANFATTSGDLWKAAPYSHGRPAWRRGSGSASREIHWPALLPLWGWPPSSSVCYW